jgi:excisionase family DNA binding protein
MPKAKAQPWNRAQDDIIEAHWGFRSSRTIAKLIARETGVVRSHHAVRSRACKLNLDHRTNQAAVSIADAVRETGVSRQKVRRLIDKGVIKATGSGVLRLIKYDDLDVIRQAYPVASFRAISTPEARKILGYTHARLTMLLQTGAMRGMLSGGRWLVDADHVDEIARQLRRTGATRLSWKHVPGLDAERSASLARTHRRRGQVPA